jgi:hypothetical protein
MDSLQQCMNVLRILALKSADPNSYLLAEREFSGYLQGPGASPEELNEAIDRKAEASRVHVEFWTTMKEFVSRGRPDGPENRCG